MNLFQRFRDALGLGEGYDEDDDYAEDEELEPDSDAENYPSDRRTPRSNVVGLPGTLMEVVLMQPRSFEEVPQAVKALQERKSVILNLMLMEASQAQRCADYVAGGAFAIDGHQKQLGPNVFLFTPSFVQITSYSGVDPAVIQQLTSFHTTTPGHP